MQIVWYGCALSIVTLALWPVHRSIQLICLLAAALFVSRPSRSLTIAVIGIVVIGMVLPYTPLAGPLGFTPLSPLFFLYLIVATGTYLVLVEIGKRVLMRRRAY